MNFCLDHGSTSVKVMLSPTFYLASFHPGNTEQRITHEYSSLYVMLPVTTVYQIKRDYRRP